MAYHMLGFGRRIAWEALLAAYQAMIREAHPLGGTTSELSNPLAKLSRILAVYSKIEVSDDEFTPLSKAEPYFGRTQQNRGVR